MTHRDWLFIMLSDRGKTRCTEFMLLHTEFHACRGKKPRENNIKIFVLRQFSPNFSFLGLCWVTAFFFLSSTYTCVLCKVLQFRFALFLINIDTENDLFFHYFLFDAHGASSHPVQLCVDHKLKYERMSRFSSVNIFTDLDLHWMKILKLV